MEIIPVIYIHKGKCVSFYKGNKEYETVYPKSPKNYAEVFASYGAKHIHIVDKDGENWKITEKITREIPEIKIQLSAKIRTIDLAEKAINLGVERIVVGVAGREILKEAVEKFGTDRVFAGIKGKDKKIITSENLPPDMEVLDYAEELKKTGVKNLIYHDVWSEGTMIHPNYDEVEKLLHFTDLNIYASGGIGDVKHLVLLEKLGVKGALIGKALYERVFNLERLFI